MPILLLVLGVVTAGAGAVMIGIGVPINEFSLGNTLIVSGTTALVGGLVVIALSVATRQLIRIATLLKPQAGSRSRAAEGYDPSGSEGSGPGRMPFPPRLPDNNPRHPETRFTPPPPPPSGASGPGDPIFDRMRHQTGQGPQSARHAEPPMLHNEEAPLSPRAPRAPYPAEQPAPDDAALARMLRGGDKASDRPVEKARNGATPPATPQPAPRSTFNDVWPDEPSRSEPDPFAARPSDPFARIPEPPAPQRNGSALREAIMREQEHVSAPVTILKSGIVDGMAYTLYTDGSIEAELAQGVVRFGSIEELRNHLEKSH